MSKKKITTRQNVYGRLYKRYPCFNSTQRKIKISIVIPALGQFEILSRNYEKNSNILYYVILSIRW